MKIKIDRETIQILPIARPLTPEEQRIIDTGLKIGGTKFLHGVEIGLPIIGITAGPRKTLEATLTVLHHSDYLYLYCAESQGRKILRYLKDNINPSFDKDPWYWWQWRKWRGQVSFSEIKIPKPAPAAK